MAPPDAAAMLLPLLLQISGFRDGCTPRTSSTYTVARNKIRYDRIGYIACIQKSIVGQFDLARENRNSER